jgi:hypothetical protein
MNPKGCGACSAGCVAVCGATGVEGGTGDGLSFPKTLTKTNSAAAPNIQFFAFDNLGSPNPQADQSKIVEGCRDKASLKALSLSSGPLSNYEPVRRVTICPSQIGFGVVLFLGWLYLKVWIVV